MRFRMLILSVIATGKDEIEDVEEVIDVEAERDVLEEMVKVRRKWHGVQVAIGESGVLAFVFPHRRGDGHLVGTLSGRTANFRLFAYNDAAPNDYALLDDTDLNFPNVH